MFLNRLNILFLLCFVLLTACSNVKNLSTGHSAPDSTEVAQQELLTEDAADQEHITVDENCFISQEKYAEVSPIPTLDLWDRLRSGYKLGNHGHKRIDQEISWFSRHSSYMKRVSKRAERYLYHIVVELEKRDMPLEIALLPIVESAFDPFAYSHGRASGMWQIVPGTGKMLGLKQNWWYDGRRDVVASTNAALNYLESHHKRFNGDWLLALASYNSGAGNVSKAVRKNKKRGKPTDFWNLDLPKETMAYVPRLLALAELVADPKYYNISLHSISDAPHFASVHVGSQIYLAQAAEFAGLDMEKFYHLNPAFNRWATDPQGPHDLLVPVDMAEVFAQKINEIPQEDRVEWKRYRIKSGDTLSTIAQKNNISVASLKNINRIKGSTIRAGKTLMVPMAKKSKKHYTYSFEERVAKRYAAVDKNEKGEKISYTVKSGDNLWDISRQFNVSVSKLARWNSMAPRDTLKPGRVLKIWTSNPPEEKKGVIRKVSYKVKSGDSLNRIAQKFRLKINDILKWNTLNKKKYLQPGQSLTLFVDVTRTQES